MSRMIPGAKVSANRGRVKLSVLLTRSIMDSIKKRPDFTLSPSHAPEIRG